MTHPYVKDTGVVGLPDEASGELPAAFVVLHQERSISVQELQSYVAEKVAPHKRLRGGIRFIDGIPRNTSGKIIRRQLKATMMEAIATEKTNKEDNEGDSLSSNASSSVTSDADPHDVVIKDNVISNEMSLDIIPKISIGEYLMKKLQKYGDKACILSAESAKSYSYNEVLDLSKRIASGLKRRGLSSNDTLFLCCPNCPEFLLSLLGATFVGSRVTLCNPSYTAAEIKHQINHSGATYVICHAVAAENVATASDGNPKIKARMIEIKLLEMSGLCNC